MSIPSGARVAIYARISLDRRGESEAPDRQLDVCRSHCEAMGWVIARELVERDRSAFARSTTRPEYDELLALARAREIEVVVAWKIDRVSRRVAELAALVDELRDLGVALVCPGDGVDTSSGVGSMIATLLGSLAQMESESNSQRRRAKNEADAQRGKYVKGGFRAFGRELDGRVVDAEADAIRRVAAEVLGGQSLASQARWLNDEGIRTSTGAAWNGTSVGRMLRGPHLRGLRVHNGDEYEGDFEAILDTEVGLRLLDRLTSNPPPRKGRAHLLAGLARCGRCGGRMALGQVKHPKDATIPPFVRYQCRRYDREGNCGSVSASERSLDSLVVDHFFQQVRHLIIAGEIVPGTDAEDALETDRAELEQQIVESKQTQSELGDARFKDRVLSHADYQRLWLSQQDAIEQAQRELHRLDTAIRAPRRDFDWFNYDFEALWDAMSVVDRREMLRSLINRVEVAPAKHRGGNKFDTSRVQIVWHEGAQVPDWLRDEGDADLPYGYRPRTSEDP